MTINEITSVLWRHRVLFAITLVASIAVVIIITAVVPRTYRATTTLLVGSDTPNLGTDQGEQLTRTYTSLAGNPNIAEAALAELDLNLTRSELLEKMSFTPIERTQLLDISAEDNSASEAQRIANTYSQVFTDEVAAAQAAGQAPSTVAISQPAIESTDPVKPNPPVYLGFGALLSLLLASGVALAADRLDRRVRIRPTDETVQGELILARIPTLLEPMAKGDGAQSRIANAARIMHSDSFRILRTNLDLATGGRPARTIMVTSPGQAEGKTTIAAQLALTMATDGEGVAIVECDMRRRALDQSGFGQQWKRASNGLADYLNGEAALKEVVRSAPSLSELKVVWAGAVTAEPGPLLRSERLPELIEGLGQANDWVIIDTPPIAVGDDALIVSSHADGTVVVVNAEETTASALEAALNQLRKVRARVLGVVINHAPPADLDAYRYLTEVPQEGVPLARQLPKR
jgi:capsular exopolysaccharide synthesis family protein